MNTLNQTIGKMITANSIDNFIQFFEQIGQPMIILVFTPYVLMFLIGAATGSISKDNFWALFTPTLLSSIVLLVTFPYWSQYFL